MKVTDKLKQLIFKRLYKELGKVEIIPALYSYWFINREEKYWYFQLTESGCLYWRYDYFKTFFTIFSLESEDFVPIISSWVEEVLNSKVSTTLQDFWWHGQVVEEVLNSKVSTTEHSKYRKDPMVEEVLNSKVSTTVPSSDFERRLLGKVLNRKVSTTKKQHNLITRSMMEEVLDIKVSKTVRDVGEGNYLVEEVLNHKVSTTTKTYGSDYAVVEKVLNNTQ